MNELLKDVWFVGSGVFLTLELLVGSLIVGLLFGVILAVLRHRGVAVFVINGYISVLRGTPLILQLSLVYYALPGILKLDMSVTAAGILTFSLNSAAYIAEILRAGIENLPRGQFEAAKTLRIPEFYMWKDIILPQVIRNILPAMINETISLLKETAIISVVSGMDIMRSAQCLSATKLTYFLPLCIAGAYYYMLVLLIEFMGRKVNKYVDYSAS